MSSLLADAYNLPFLDDVFEVVFADPPYEGKARGKKHHTPKATGYVTYDKKRGRTWSEEAWRVLRPGGHLYLVTIIKEMWLWYDVLGQPADVLSWHARNSPSLSAYWRRGIGGRALAWRPILHYQKPPVSPIKWPDGYVQPNVFDHPLVIGNMKEALPWPNQLPIDLVREILAPHKGPVLDLFSGTGTTQEAALGLGFPAVSVDCTKEAVSLGRTRRVPTLALFAGEGQSGE